MRVRDLGAVAVAVDADERPVAGLRATAMLALLTINANRRVSVDALMDAAWGENITPGAASSLDSHIWRLRQLLEPGRTPRQPPTVLVNDAGGYRLVAGAHSVDSLLFSELAGEVRDLLTTGHAAAAVVRADKALALWRGRPYGPLAERAWAQPAVARLDEMHGQVAARRIEALVEAGALDQALSDVEPLIAAMPFREPLRAQQMLALYRSGRGEQALQCYRDAHRMFMQEVGTEPGAELRDLHRRILDDDAGLAPPDPARRTSVASTVHAPEVHLPGTLTPLIGRDDVLSALGELVRARRLVTVVGAAGCGKTRLSIEVARLAAPAFGEGVWFVDLGSVSDPDLVVETVVSTVGFAATAGGTALEDLGDYLRARRVLLVLDNCEHVLPAVARIVDASLVDTSDPSSRPECAVLATSREPIDVAGETIWTLEPLRLPRDDAGTDRLAAPAVALFLQRLAAAAPTLSVDDHVLDCAVEICVALDGLPLPIELAAARVRSHTLDDIVDQVSADPGRLGRVGRGGGDHRSTVQAAIEWSHRMLTVPEQVAHRRLAVLPGPFTSSMAAAVLGEVVIEGAPAEADDLLANLVHRSMLSAQGAQQSRGSTTFRQLATVRAHAHRALVDVDEKAEITDRRDAWTATLVAARPRLGSPDEIEWFRALDDGYATIRATLARHLIDEPAVQGARIAAGLGTYWYYRARVLEGTRWLQLAHDVIRRDAPDARPIDRVTVRLALGAALALQGRIDLARPHVEYALASLPSAAPEDLVGVGEGLVGLISSAFVPAAWMPAAVELIAMVYERLRRVVDEADDPDLELVAAAVGCSAAFAAGRWQEAVRDAERVHERASAAGNIMATWVSAAPPMLVAMLRADPDTGIPWFRRLVRGYAQLGTGGAGSPLEVRANFAAQAGDYRRAATIYAAARAENRRAALTWPRWELTRALEQTTRDRLPRAEYEQAWQDGERLSVEDVLRAG